MIKEGAGGTIFSLPHCRGIVAEAMRPHDPDHAAPGRFARELAIELGD